MASSQLFDHEASISKEVRKTSKADIVQAQDLPQNSLYSKEELLTLKQLASTEMRIYKIYAEQAQNDMRKQKMLALRAHEQMKQDTA